MPCHGVQYREDVRVDQNVFKTSRPAATLETSNQHAIFTLATFPRSPWSRLNLSTNQFVDMATQTALLVQEIGKPLVLVNDRLIPEAGHGQVQLKVKVAGKSDARRRGIALLSLAASCCSYTDAMKQD